MLVFFKSFYCSVCDKEYNLFLPTSNIPDVTSHNLFIVRSNARERRPTTRRHFLQEGNMHSSAQVDMGTHTLQSPQQLLLQPTTWTRARPFWQYLKPTARKIDSPSAWYPRTATHRSCMPIEAWNCVGFPIVNLIEVDMNTYCMQLRRVHRIGYCIYVRRLVFALSDQSCLLIRLSPQAMFGDDSYAPCLFPYTNSFRYAVRISPRDWYGVVQLSLKSR